MKILTRFKKKSDIQKEIDWIIDQMKGMAVGSEEYRAALDNLEQMYKVKQIEKTNGVSKDTVAIVAGNLLGILLILNYEKLDVVSTKALGFVIKGRV